MTIALWLVHTGGNNSSLCSCCLTQAEASQRGAEQAKAQRKLQGKAANRIGTSSAPSKHQAAEVQPGSSSVLSSKYEEQEECQAEAQQKNQQQQRPENAGSVQRSAAGTSTEGSGGSSEASGSTGVAWAPNPVPASATAAGRVPNIPSSSSSSGAEVANSSTAAPSGAAAASVAAAVVPSVKNPPSQRRAAAAERQHLCSPARASHDGAGAPVAALSLLESGGEGLSSEAVAAPEPKAWTPGLDVVSLPAKVFSPGAGSKPRRLKRVECVVCLDARAEVMLLPCKHTILCQACAGLVREGGKPCPMCRAEVDGEVLVGSGVSKGAMMDNAVGASVAAGHSSSRRGTGIALNAPAQGAAEVTACMLEPPQQVAAHASSSSSSGAARQHTPTGSTWPQMNPVAVEPSRKESAAAGERPLLPATLLGGLVGQLPPPSLPKAAGLSSSSSSSGMPSAWQRPLPGGIDVGSSSSSKPQVIPIHQVMEDPPFAATVPAASSSSTWRPPMLEHLFLQGPSSLHSSISSRSPLLVPPPVAGEGSSQSSGRTHAGACTPGDAAGAVGSAGGDAAYSQLAHGSNSIQQNDALIGGTVEEQQPQQQYVLSAFMHEVAGLLADTEAQANSLVAQTEAELNHNQMQLDHSQSQLQQSRMQLAEFQAQVDHFAAQLHHSQLHLDAARGDLDQRRGQFDQRRGQLMGFLDQHRQRMQQLCAKYGMPQEHV